MTKILIYSGWIEPNQKILRERLPLHEIFFAEKEHDTPEIHARHVDADTAVFIDQAPRGATFFERAITIETTISAGEPAAGVSISASEVHPNRAPLESISFPISSESLSAFELRLADALTEMIARLCVGPINPGSTTKTAYPAKHQLALPDGGSVIIEAVRPIAPHIRALFDLISARDPKVRISAGTPPPFDDHRRFVENHPYRCWFLISEKETYSGAFYLQYDNSLSINLKRFDELVYLTLLQEITNRWSPLPPIPSLRSGKFHINVAPGNQQLSDLLQSADFKPIQVTYARS